MSPAPRTTASWWPPSPLMESPAIIVGLPAGETLAAAGRAAMPGRGAGAEGKAGVEEIHRRSLLIESLSCEQVRLLLLVGAC